MNKYNIKIRTKEGTYDYEEVDLQELDLILTKHPLSSELYAERVDKTKRKEKTPRYDRDIDIRR